MKTKVVTSFIILSFFWQFLSYSITEAQTLTAEQRAQLEQQLAQVQREQQQAQNDLMSAQKKSSTLQNDINTLAAKIKIEQLNIQAKTLEIKQLGDNIVNKQVEIKNLDEKIAEEKANIATVFRSMSEADSISMIEMILSNNTISGFLDDANSLNSIQSNLLTLAQQLQGDVSQSTNEKNTLIDKKNATVDAQYAIQQEQNVIKSNQANQKILLALNKNSEKSYAALVTQKKAEAAAINAKLFNLAGGSNPIPFGQAYKYALVAQQKTGIDPAYLLAIMTQESNLGTNQGTCYLTDTNTGAGTSVKTGKSFPNVMSPTRDVPPFINITSALGLDPYKTYVSCPQSVGWGGAMGAAQFIASTWVLFSDRIQRALDTSDYANPWNPEHAFIASALYLTDLGAANGGYTAQKNAACKYYSGSSCSKSRLIATYGASVLNLASKIQLTEIDKLQ
jgi:peptidoglycan hydrolase CwlO-like protein